MYFQQDASRRSFQLNWLVQIFSATLPRHTNYIGMECVDIYNATCYVFRIISKHLCVFDM